MERATESVLVVVVSLSLCSSSAYSLPERVVIRLGEGEIGWGDRAIAFSPDSAMLAVATSIGVYLYDPLTGEEIDFLEANDWLSCVAFSPDGSLLASGGNHGMVKLWDVASHQLVDTLPGPSRWGVSSVAFNPGGSLLASGSSHDIVRLWDVSSHQLVGILAIVGSLAGVSSVTFSPDGSLLASGSGYGVVFCVYVAYM